MTLESLFAQRATELIGIDFQTSPSKLLEKLTLAALDIWDLLALPESLGLVSYRQTVTQVSLLRSTSAKELILAHDTPVVIALRTVVPLLARIFGIDSMQLEKSDLYSTACREHLREILVALLRREGEVRLFRACIQVLGQRAEAAKNGYPGIFCFEVDEGTAETANLVRFLTELDLKPVAVDMPGVGHLLTF